MDNYELANLVHAGKVASVTVFGKEWKVGNIDDNGSYIFNYRIICRTTKTNCYFVGSHNTEEFLDGIIPMKLVEGRLIEYVTIPPKPNYIPYTELADLKKLLGTHVLSNGDFIETVIGLYRDQDFKWNVRLSGYGIRSSGTLYISTDELLSEWTDMNGNALGIRTNQDMDILKCYKSTITASPDCDMLGDITLGWSESSKRHIRIKSTHTSRLYTVINMKRETNRSVRITTDNERHLVIEFVNEVDTNGFYNGYAS